MTATIELGLNDPIVLASSFDSIWLAGSGRIQRRDPESGELVAAADSPIAHPMAIAVAADSVLVAGADGALATFDGTGELTARQDNAGPTILASNGSEVWAAQAEANEVHRLDNPGDATVVAAPLAALAVNQHGWWSISAGYDEVNSSTGPHSLPFMPTGALSLSTCEGSIWLASHEGLSWINGWSGEFGGTIAWPAEPIATIACVGGVMLAADRLDAVLIVDPASDTGMREVSLSESGPVIALGGALGTAWIVGEDGRAHLLTM